MAGDERIPGFSGENDSVGGDLVEDDYAAIDRLGDFHLELEGLFCHLGGDDHDCSGCYWAVPAVSAVPAVYVDCHDLDYHDFDFHDFDGQDCDDDHCY